MLFRTRHVEDASASSRGKIVETAEEDGEQAPPPSAAQGPRPDPGGAPATWRTHLPLLDDIDIEACLLRPVRTLRFVPARAAAAWRDTLAEVLGALDAAVGGRDGALQHRMEALWLILPKLLLAAPAPRGT